MGRSAKIYVYGVIAVGGIIIAGALASWSSLNPHWILYLALVLFASSLKLRLPGMDGAYSLSFLFMLYGVAHFSLQETLLAGCAGAVASSLLNTRKHPSVIQVLFNIANLAITVGACFFIARVYLASGIAKSLPAVIVIAACAYFLINTALVSGVLSLLQGKRLVEVLNEWYVWSFPYYLIGAALVGLFPSPGRAVPGEAWLILLPLFYLVHFFLGLLEWHASPGAVDNQANVPLPPAAKAFVRVVATAGVLLLGIGIWRWDVPNPERFLSFLVLGVVASSLKIRLPGMRGTLSPGFVLVLASIMEMSLGEVAVMAAVVGVVQVLWRSAQPPTLAQVLFNPASLALSAASAYAVCRILLEPWLVHSLASNLVVAAVILYGLNSLLVATVLALLDRKPLGAIWRLCYFWSLPYYLVGAAMVGVMMAISRTADWRASLLVSPVMGLVYLSYRVHVRRAGERKIPAAA